MKKVKKNLLEEGSEIDEKPKFLKQLRKIAITSFIFLIVLSLFIVSFMVFSRINRNKQKVENYWQDQSGYYYTPIELIKNLENINLVDVRNSDDYSKKGHIKNSVNIPLKDNKGKARSSKEIMKQISILDKSRDIVIYGENNYTDDALEMAVILEKNQISSKVLKVGWNEFAYFSTFWIPQGLASEITPIDYIVLPN